MKKVYLVTISIVLLYLTNFKLQAQVKNDSINLSLINYKISRLEEFKAEIQKLIEENIITQDINKYKYKQTSNIKLDDLSHSSSDTLRFKEDYKKMHDEESIQNKIQQSKKVVEDLENRNNTINYDTSRTINIDNNKDTNKGRGMNNNRDRSRDLKRDKNRDRGRDKNRDRNKERSKIITKIKINIQ